MIGILCVIIASYVHSVHSAILGVDAKNRKREEGIFGYVHSSNAISFLLDSREKRPKEPHLTNKREIGNCIGRVDATANTAVPSGEILCPLENMPNGRHGHNSGDLI